MEETITVVFTHGGVKRLQAAGFCIKKNAVLLFNNFVYKGHVIGGCKIKPMECMFQATGESIHEALQILPQIHTLLHHHYQPSH